MIIESLFLSLIVGKIRGGQMDRIKNMKIKKAYLFILAFAIECLLSFAYIKSFTMVERYGLYLYLISYLLFLVGYIFNIRHLWLNVIAFGILLNIIAIFVKGGKIPIFLQALPLVEMPEAIVPLIPPYLFAKAISIGDIVIALGIFFLIQQSMKKKPDIFL